MAIPFLSDIKLNGNQIKELVVDHKSGSNPTGGYHGQLIFRTDENKIYINTSTNVNSSSWSSIAGDITAITAGDGLTGDATTGDVSLAVGASKGITVSANKVSADVDDSTINFDGSTDAAKIQIKDGGVDTTQLAAGAVSFVKMQNIQSPGFIGRNTSGVGNIEALTTGTVKTMLGITKPPAIEDDGGSPAFASGITKAEVQTLLNVADGATNTAAPAIENSSGSPQFATGITKAEVLTLLNVEDGATATSNTDVLQGNSAATDDDDKFITFVESATGAQQGKTGANFKFNPGLNGGTLYVPNVVVSGTQTVQNETVQVVENNTIQFEGTTADAHEIKLTAADATSSDKTITLPNLSGHVALLNAAATETITATPAELNTLDGFDGDVDDLKYAKDLYDTGVTATEFDKLDGSLTPGTSAVINSDGFIHNDGGTMKQTQVGKIATLFAGTGLTATSGVINMDAAQSGITSAYNTALKVGRASNGARIDFGTSGAVSIIANSDGQGGIKVQETQTSPISNNSVDLGNQSNAFKDLYLAGSLKLSGTTVTASGAELNHTDGVTSNIQTQLDAKEPSSNKVTKKIAGDASTTAFEITHGLGTPLVRTTVLNYGNDGTNATYENVYVAVKNSTTSNSGNNKITVTFGSAPSATEDYLVLVEKFPAVS